MYLLSIFAFTNIPLSRLKLYAKLVVVAENQKSINFDNVAWKIFPRGGHVLQNKFARRGFCVCN